MIDFVCSIVFGFDEFMGNLYHLNAEEEPENEDYPRDVVMQDGRTFLETFGPRGVIHPYSDGRIEDTGLSGGMEPACTSALM